MWLYIVLTHIYSSYLGRQCIEITSKEYEGVRIGRCSCGWNCRCLCECEGTSGDGIGGEQRGMQD